MRNCVFRLFLRNTRNTLTGILLDRQINHRICEDFCRHARQRNRRVAALRKVTITKQDGKKTAKVVIYLPVKEYNAGGVKNLSGILLVLEFTEEFTMGNSNVLSVGSFSNSCRKNPATQNLFHNTQFHELPIRDAGMADEISKFFRSQILYQANTAIHAQAFLPLIRDFCK